MDTEIAGHSQTEEKSKIVANPTPVSHWTFTNCTLGRLFVTLNIVGMGLVVPMGLWSIVKFHYVLQGL